MTREEAVLILTRLEKGCDEYAGLTNYAKEAFQMAITALQTDGDCISRQAAIDEITEYGSGDTIYMSVVELKRRIEHLPPAQPDNSCDGCRYENADDGVLVPCGFCKRSHPDNYERRTDEQTKD